MFKKIKRDFLILNMSIISILLILVCIYIYFSMRFNIYSQMNKEMSDIEQNYQNYYSFSELRNSLAMNTNKITENDEFLFVVDVSEKYVINYFNTTNSNDMKLMQELTEICIEINNGKGLVQYEEKYYFFSKIYFLNAATRLIVLDVSDRIYVLHELWVNLVLIGTVSLFFIFLMSNFFTSKSMKPLEEAFTKQKHFISDASHELKTPLAVVKTNLDVLRKSDALTQEDRKWLVYATDEIDQMSKMVNEFLYLAKMDSKMEAISEGSCDFSSIISGVLLTMEAIAFEKQVMVEENIKDNVFVKGNYDELKRLIVILVDNAIKYCNENGKVFATLETNGNNGVFTIKNTGTVIDVKEKDIIFEKFYRANKERERKSHSYGIGLSIAKSTCDKYGFSIKAYPENDMTCFRLGFKVLVNNEKNKANKSKE